MNGPQRYSAVPWLSTADLEPQGEPETIDLGDDITQRLHVIRPFGKDTDSLLLVHANRDSKEITLAIPDGAVPMADAPRPKHWPKPAPRITIGQWGSSPRRANPPNEDPA